MFDCFIGILPTKKWTIYSYLLNVVTLYYPTDLRHIYEEFLRTISVNWLQSTR